VKSLPVALAGLLLGVSLAAALAIPATAKRMAQAREGWRLVPVVVAAVDVKPGELLTMEQISQRSIPEQFVSPSMVRPDEASFIVNRKVETPLLAGDPVRWPSLLDPPMGSRFSACVTAVKPLADARGLEVGEAAVSSLHAKARSFDGPPPALDVPTDGRVVKVTRALTEGTVLRDGDLAVVTVPPVLRLPSLVSESERALLPGARLLVDLDPGDLLRWQMLDDAEAPSSKVGCEVTVGADVAAARAERARAAARAWGEAYQPPEATP
jgi:flagella basal body P-ring formation protein FlgA